MRGWSKVRRERNALEEILLVSATILLVGLSLTPCLAGQQATAPASAGTATAKALGTVKAISGNNITLTPESGGEVSVTVQEGARVVRVEPGSTDLRNAAPMQLQDLQTGDRILVRGTAGDGGKTLVAVSVIAMKKADLAEKHAHEREEWQRKGVGGLVTAVDAAAGKIQLDTSALGANKNVTVTVSKNTVMRRYAPGSVSFDDAKPAPIEEIKAGDQLRARGSKTGDGTTLAADEIVSGSFRNISGTVTSIDAGAGTIAVNDLATKRPVVVKVGPGTQLRKLPQAMAQRIAVRLKGNSEESANGSANGTSTAGGRPGANPTSGSASAAVGGAPTNAAPGGAPGARRAESGAAGPGGTGERQGGDLQQAIARMPAATLAELQKGDAVMIVATSDSGSNTTTAITLLAGVEPILQASPSGGQSLLTPWSLSSAPGGDAGTQ